MSEWHLDKRVPIAIIFALIIQSASIVWWASSVDVRIANLEKTQTLVVTNQARIIALESDSRGQNVSLKRIEDKLDRLIERESGH